MNTNETDIVKLNLNDTFYDWYLRTNQIIDYVNPINVYDVLVGNGLSESRTGTPGTVELSVATDSTLYGITTLVNTDGSSLVVLDYSSLSIGTVENTSIFSFQAADSQIYKVEASDILPPDLNGDHTFSGAITVGDLTVSDGNITLIADTSTNGENAGLYVTGAETETVFFTYDIETSAWYSSNNLGITNGTGFVTNAAGDAVYPFIASETQAQVDLQLQSTVSGTPERFSVYAEFDATNTLTFSHYSNGSLVSDILELTSTGTNGSSVVVKDTITITDVLNSTPFSQSPAVETVPVTDSTDGFLNDFVNRVVLPNDNADVGDFVYVNSSGQATRADATTLSHTYQVGIVESVNGSDVTIITSGSFSGLLSGLTAGDIYYLAETAGDVTNTNPQDDTNGTFGKPAFIATSDTSGILIPDFTNLGGGGTTVIGGGLSDAFGTITVLDSTGSTLETYVASGSDTITFQEGSNITFTTGTSPDKKITINATSSVPDPGTSDAYSILTSDSTSSFVYTGVGESSVVGRVTNGEVASIALTQGTILGRGSDTNDNGVEALTPTQVLDILGFSGNSFLKTVNFETVSAETVYSYPDTDDGEILTIRAGSNVTFDFIGGYLYINADVAGSTDLGGGGGGPGSIGVAVSGGSFTAAENIIFGGADYIDFTKTDVGAGNVQITGTPSSNYLGFGQVGGTSFQHNPGTILQFGSSNQNLSVTATQVPVGDDILEFIYYTLANRIALNAITSNSPFLLWTNGKSGAPEPGGEPWTLGITDKNFSGRQTDLASDGTGSSIIESAILINGFEKVVYPDPIRVSTFISGANNNFQHEYAVSMYADIIQNAGTGSNLTNPLPNTTYVTNGGLRCTMPFRFYEIIVDKLRVNDLVVDTAAKTREYLGTVFGNHGGTSAPTNIVRFSTDTLNFGNYGASGQNGIQLYFEDDADSSDSSSATIFKPTQAYIDGTLTHLPYRTFVIADHLTFGSTDTNGIQDTTLYSPVLGRGGSGTLNISNDATGSTELSISANGSGQFDVGIQSGDNGYSYLNFNDTTNDYYLRLSSDSILKTNSLVLLNDTSGGITLDISTDFSTSDTGKIMMITSVDTGGMATVEPTYVIKPFGDGNSVLTDPINTLYYTAV